MQGITKHQLQNAARLIIKIEMRKQGIKISHVDAKEITKAADLLIAEADENMQAAIHMVARELA